MFMQLHKFIAIASLLQPKVTSLHVRAMSQVWQGNNSQSVTFMDAALSKLVDDRLMAVPGFSIDQLMELAGYGVASSVLHFWENYNSKHNVNKNVLIFCGPGNNGGDGLVAARHLKHFGFQPTIVYPKKGQSVLFENLIQQLVDLDVRTLDHTPNSLEYSTYGLAIDSLFGFSFQGPSREPFTSMIKQFAASSIPVFSVDIPSGWDVNKGDIHQTGFVPSAVISLTAPKLCMREYEGTHYAGGRFMPPNLAAELGIVLPDYGFNSNQFVLLSEGGVLRKVPRETTPENESISAIVVTASSITEARALARTLLQRRLVACVNLLPGIESMYEWKGRLESSQEIMLVIKTRRSLVEAVTAAVRELHSYSVPEVLALDVAGGSDAYLDWVRTSTSTFTNKGSGSSGSSGENNNDEKDTSSTVPVGALRVDAVTGGVVSTGAAAHVAADTCKYSSANDSETGCV